MFDLLGLTCFIYIKLFNNGKRLYLSSDCKWMDLYVEKELYKDPKHESVAISMEKNWDSKTILWQERMLPLMSKMLVGMTIFFFVISLHVCVKPCLPF